jgi:hypothetical protein
MPLGGHHHPWVPSSPRLSDNPTTACSADGSGSLAVLRCKADAAAALEQGGDTPAGRGSPYGSRNSSSGTRSGSRSTYDELLLRGGAAAAGAPLSARQVWRSLPSACKALVAFLIVEAAAWLAATVVSGATGCSWGVVYGKHACSPEHWQAMASTLAAQLAAAWLTACAVADESARQLVAGAGLSVLSGVVWIAFEVRRQPA